MLSHFHQHKMAGRPGALWPANKHHSNKKSYLSLESFFFVSKLLWPRHIRICQKLMQNQQRKRIDWINIECSKKKQIFSYMTHHSCCCTRTVKPPFNLFRQYVILPIFHIKWYWFFSFCCCSTSPIHPSILRAVCRVAQNWPVHLLHTRKYNNSLGI